MSCNQQALRLLAIQRDAEASRPFDLGDLWQELCHGAWIFRDTFETEERYLALLQRSDRVPTCPLSERKLRLLESVLLGTPPKVVALDNHRSLSSITGSIQECVHAMGLAGRTSRAPLLLTMAARAFHGGELATRVGRLSELEDGDETYWVVSAPRPDLRFPVPLSLAETAVLRGLLAGKSYAQISGARATSMRTVANQLATAFRKLGVSGRRATIACLMQHSAALE